MACRKALARSGHCAECQLDVTIPLDLYSDRRVGRTDGEIFVGPSLASSSLGHVLVKTSVPLRKAQRLESREVNRCPSSTTHLSKAEHSQVLSTEFFSHKQYTHDEQAPYL